MFRVVTRLEEDEDVKFCCRMLNLVCSNVEIYVENIKSEQCIPNVHLFFYKMLNVISEMLKSYCLSSTQKLYWGSQSDEPMGPTIQHIYYRLRNPDYV
jgi:hypothetical protein